MSNSDNPEDMKISEEGHSHKDIRIGDKVYLKDSEEY
jgi:hypothetical protein